MDTDLIEARPMTLQTVISSDKTVLTGAACRRERLSPRNASVQK